ncbi:GNAT family N-acetyltransferase [Brevibacillus choshinensis]|uniref:GNAT family N-acetyltransferase n=1 Tax=Brevibacillus choshinensis TaxID=54911 RepID=A0ABX7FJI9_BRECH|nr:GNAT family protein [Brevibacillus choshinensis]QRG66376.1 GNAT family N-acetyltransferase [Brevibacillus choshinensis]
MSIYLKGEKVVLRDIRPEDIDLIYMWKYEADDREHLNWNGPYKPLDPLTKEEHRALPRYQESLALVGSDAPRTELILEIDGQLRGSVGRYWVSEETNWCEIGIVIYDSCYWSNGYGSEAFQMWIDYLFTHMDTVRLGIGTWSGNERMIKLAARCGMREEARVRKARIVRGEYYDAIKMGMLKEEWEALRQNS